jgi:hypothetical protein
LLIKSNRSRLLPALKIFGYQWWRLVPLGAMRSALSVPELVASKSRFRKVVKGLGETVASWK